MHVAEFLKRTDRRNLNSQIDCKVQQKLGECQRHLQHRRRQLALQLQSEAQLLDEEMMELLQAHEDMEKNARIEWIQMAVLKNEEADQQLLKTKKEQREIECSEAHRHKETKDMLLNTKQAQLYQIEERRSRRRIAAYMDKQWQL
ncbi:hypothetical protein KR093_002220 [Drosophila rubida]|uniref:Uncharacterized protein n=1 Tax=Drosophila rubida TaxID=30044 RepID=A0AAD4PKF7_9MUSC|nr:hypothetical protein KR093_002220 [Drosophila rubida]